MKKQTKDQIAAEIVALKKLKPIGLFARKTAATIEVQLDVLHNSGVVDDSCDEWNDLTDEQQSAAYDVQNWVNGDSDAKPSEDWGGLCA